MTDFVSIPADKARDLAQYHRDRSNAGPAVVSHDAARWHRETADLLDPQPPTLREQLTRKGLGIAFAGATSMSAEMAEGVAARYADAVLAVVADWLAAQPRSQWTDNVHQRDHDVRLLRDGGAS